MARMKLALVLTAAAICAGSAAAGVPPRAAHTSDGTKLAQASLLRIGDFGSGWSESPAGVSSGLNLSCKGYAPKQGDLVETGAATSPNFKGSTIGPFVIQKTSAYETPETVAKLWQRAVKARLSTCVAQSLQALTSRGIGVAITATTTVPIGTPAERTASYRVVATLTTKKQHLQTYFDVLLLASGRTITELTISQFQKPPPLKWEIKLAKVAARRIGSGGPAA
jgi:hypothetical protein